MKKKIPVKESETVEFKTSFNDEVIESLVAFTNTKGGSVYLGVRNDGKVQGINVDTESIQKWVNEIKSKTYPNLIPEVSTIESRGRFVAVFSIREYPIKPIAVRGRYYKRVGNSNHLLGLQEISDMYLRTFNTSWDSYVTNNYSLEAVSLEKVNRFINLVNQIRDNRIIDDPLTVLRKFDILKGEGVTNACYLLFAAGDVFQAAVQIGRFADAITIKDDRTIRSDLFSQIEGILDAVKKHINKELIISGSPQHEEHWQYPLNALREIVVNMIVHRNYQDSGDSIIKIFNERIEFFNPGGLIGGLSVEQLLSGNYSSHVRNKKIASIFKEAGIIEQYGSGISRVIKTFNDYGLIAPVFENFQHGFRVTVFSKKADVVENVVENVVEKRAIEEKILKTIKQNRRISASDIAKHLGVSGRTVQRYLRKLQDRNAIRRIGSDKGGYWEEIKR